MKWLGKMLLEIYSKSSPSVHLLIQSSTIFLSLCFTPAHVNVSTYLCTKGLSYYALKTQGLACRTYFCRRVSSMLLASKLLQKLVKNNRFTLSNKLPQLVRPVSFRQKRGEERSQAANEREEASQPCSPLCSLFSLVLSFQQKAKRLLLWSESVSAVPKKQLSKRRRKVSQEREEKTSQQQTLQKVQPQSSLKLRREEEV